VTTDIRALGEDDGLVFCRSLPERCGVVAIPNVVFYDDQDAGRSLVRFTFCKRPEVLDEAIERLATLSRSPAADRCPREGLAAAGGTFKGLNR
jgi:N-succinyldiaminopimelate aminotransferase